MPTNPPLTGLAFIKAMQASPTLPTLEPEEEPLKLVSPEDMANLMNPGASEPDSLVPGSNPGLPSKAPNYKTAQFPAFSTPLVTAYWQGLPPLTLEAIKNLDLSTAVAFLKVRQLGWRGLAETPDHLRMPYYDQVNYLKANVASLYVDKVTHAKVVGGLMSLGVPVTKEKTMSKAYAQTALDAWVEATLTHCASEGITNPLETLSASQGMAAMSDADFLAALDLL